MGARGGGGTGPALAESGLDSEEIEAVIDSGAGIMPPAIVTGQNKADVVAYVESIANP